MPDAASRLRMLNRDWDRINLARQQAREHVAVARERSEHSSPLAPVAADPGGTETKPEQNLHEKGSEG